MRHQNILHASIRSKWPTHLQRGSKREFRLAPRIGKTVTVTRRMQACPVAASQHSYPSPCRFAAHHGKPVTFFRSFLANLDLVIGYQRNLAPLCHAECANSGASVTTQLGRILCRKHLSSLPLWPCLALQVALRATLSVVLRVQQAALSPLRCSTQIRRAQQLPVPHSACFATTRASTAVNKRTSNDNRYGGTAPIARRLPGCETIAVSSAALNMQRAARPNGEGPDKPGGQGCVPALCAGP